MKVFIVHFTDPDEGTTISAVYNSKKKAVACIIEGFAEILAEQDFDDDAIVEMLAVAKDSLEKGDSVDIEEEGTQFTYRIEEHKVE